MSLGFVVLGMILGLASATCALVLGAGWGTALMIYSGVGTCGVAITILAVALRADGARRDREALTEARRIAPQPQAQ